MACKGENLCAQSNIPTVEIIDCCEVTIETCVVSVKERMFPIEIVEGESYLSLIHI